jgi:hypothetical protein
MKPFGQAFFWASLSKSSHERGQSRPSLISRRFPLGYFQATAVLDYLLAAVGRKAGATELVTFDRRRAREPDVRLL